MTCIEANGQWHVVQAEAGQAVMQVAIENNIRGMLADCGGSC